MRLQWVASVMLTLILLAGLSQGAQTPMPGSEISIDLIRVKQAVQLLDDGARVVFVDVRSRQEYLIRHIKGALSIPVDNIDLRSRDIPRDGIVVLY
jgi:hypothetical protein